MAFIRSCEQFVGTVEAATNCGSERERLDGIAARSTAMRDFDGNGSTVDHGGRLPSSQRFSYHSTAARSAAMISRASRRLCFHDNVPGKDTEKDMETV